MIKAYTAGGVEVEPESAHVLARRVGAGDNALHYARMNGGSFFDPAEHNVADGFLDRAGREVWKLRWVSPDQFSSYLSYLRSGHKYLLRMAERT